VWVLFIHNTLSRVPKDKRIIKDEVTERDVWWGDVNIGLSHESYTEVEKIALDYL
jgi:phosphoenolpyruvate carboxykinase (ATP)